MRIVSKNLTFVYNKQTEFASVALSNVSLIVEEGEFFGIIGHTGSGKSTFIQHLNGLIPLQEGSLQVGDFNLKFFNKKEYKKICSAGYDCVECFENGKKLSYRKYKKRRLENMKKLRASVGMVFQYPEYQLFGESVFTDVAFGVKNFFPEFSEEQVAAAVKDAITCVGLDYEEVKDKSPFDLSGGQKRRVAIAGVIVTKPKILVLDEPVAGLDPQGKIELMELLHNLHKTVCKTVIIVSHDMDDVAENCSRVAVFSGGKLVDCLPPRELFKKADELTAVGLDIPLTAKLSKSLEEIGVSIDTNFAFDDFVKETAKKYKEAKVH